jgi:hypothetical protein
VDCAAVADPLVGAVDRAADAVAVDPVAAGAVEAGLNADRDRLRRRRLKVRRKPLTRTKNRVPKIDRTNRGAAILEVRVVTGAVVMARDVAVAHMNRVEATGAIAIAIRTVIRTATSIATVRRNTVTEKILRLMGRPPKARTVACQTNIVTGVWAVTAESPTRRPAAPNSAIKIAADAGAVRATGVRMDTASRARTVTVKTREDGAGAINNSRDDRLRKIRLKVKLWALRSNRSSRIYLNNVCCSFFARPRLKAAPTNFLNS